MTRIPEELMAQYNNAEPIIMSLNQVQSEIIQACQQIVSQSEGFYALCSKQPKCSRILEESLQFLYQDISSQNIMLIKNSFYELIESVSDVSMDNNGSHVIQTLLTLISRLSREDQQLDKSYEQLLKNFFELENGKQLIQSPHAVHIFKSILLNESGITTQDGNTLRKKHQIANVIGDTVYGAQDKFFRKTSNHYQFAYQSIYSIITEIGITPISKLPDTSSLLQTMISTNANGWAEQKNNWLFFLYELIGCKQEDNQNKIQQCIQDLIQKKALIWDNSFILKDNSDQDTQHKYIMSEKINETIYIIRSYIGSDVYQFLNQLNQSQVFLLEKLLEQKQLQIICFYLLQQMKINDILDSNDENQSKYMPLLIKCINNVFFCPQMLVKLLIDVQSSIEAIFESEKDCYVISSVINSVNRILLRKGHTDLEQVDLQTHETLNKMLEQLINNVVKYVESGNFVFKKLLFPNLDIQDPIQLQNHSFSHNQKYEIQYLNIQVDKNTIGENEFKELMTKKKEEHEKIKNVKLSLRYGQNKFLNKSSEKQNIIYGPGKDIIIKCIESSNDNIRNIFIESFEASFLEQIEIVISSTIFQLIDCPATNDLIITIMDSSKVPLSLKLKIINSQKHKYNDLSKFKLGRLFILKTAKSLYQQVLLNDKQYDIAVNMSGICLLIEEIASKLSNVQLLKQSDEGKQIIISLDLEKWIQDQDAWIKKTWAKLCKLAKQNNLSYDENGFQKFNYMIVKQIKYQERKQQHKIRQQQISNSKKYYELRQKAKAQDLK